MVDTPDLEDQDQAEVLDETNLLGDDEGIANFDEIPDVLDVTSAVGDAGEDEEADDGIETEEDVEAERDADLSPRTRLEDRPENSGLASRSRAGGSAQDQVIDDEDASPAGLEGRGGA